MDFDFVNEIIVPDSNSYITFGGVAGVELATGSTGQRVNVAGILRYNSTTTRNEQYYGTTWGNIGTGDGSVTSVGFNDASTTPIYTVNNSPVTTTGTLTITLNTQAKNTHFVGPASGVNAQPSFRTISLLQNDVSDVSITTPSTNQALVYNGTAWVNTALTATSYSTTVGPGGTIAWALVSGTKYNATITHNLGTKFVVIMCYNVANNNVVIPDQITITSTNAVIIQVVGNTVEINVTIIANGSVISGSIGGVTSITGTANQVIASASTGIITLSLPQNINSGAAPVFAGTNFTAIPNSALSNSSITVTGGTGLGVAGSPVSLGGTVTLSNTGVTSIVAGTGISVSGATGAVTVSSTLPPVQAIRTLTFVASSLDSPNNADWTVNALAATVADPTNSAINVRQFSNTIEQGVGTIVPIPSNATNISFVYQGRPQTAPGAASTLVLNLYARVIANPTTPAAVGAWSAAHAFTSVAVPTNVFVSTYTYTVTLATLSLTAGNTYQFEITRAASGVASNWLMSLLSIAFT